MNYNQTLPSEQLATAAGARSCGVGEPNRETKMSPACAATALAPCVSRAALDPRDDREQTAVTHLTDGSRRLRLRLQLRLRLRSLKHH